MYDNTTEEYSSHFYNEKNDNQQGFYITPLHFVILFFIVFFGAYATYTIGHSEGSKFVQHKWLKATNCSGATAKPVFLDNGNLVCAERAVLKLK